MAEARATAVRYRWHGQSTRAGYRRDGEDDEMLGISVVPGRPDTAVLVDLPEPPLSDGEVLVRARQVGICGTDAEIVFDGYGATPDGEASLVLGHESLGEVIEAPADSGLVPGDLVVGIVRRPDPEPCASCAQGQWDMCRNGGFVERGIGGAHGYGTQRWRVGPDFAIRVDPALGDLGVLLEPTSVVAKAWEHVQRIGSRAHFDPEVVVVTGAGPVGLLAAMLARQRGLATWVLDIVSDGPKPQLVRDLGATYSNVKVSELPVRPDVVIECTGLAPVLTEVVAAAAPNAVIALAGVSHDTHVVQADLNAVNRQMVLGNQVVFGTVNAARRHYDHAALALSQADPDWLAAMITRRVPMASWTDALTKQADDIKVVVTLDDTGT
jgi:threonine dehydrogenase-like Zn-dependent dehydrogenase